MGGYAFITHCLFRVRLSCHRWTVCSNETSTRCRPKVRSPERWSAVSLLYMGGPELVYKCGFCTIRNLDSRGESWQPRIHGHLYIKSDHLNSKNHAMLECSPQRLGARGPPHVSCASKIQDKIGMERASLAQSEQKARGVSREPIHGTGRAVPTRAPVSLACFSWADFLRIFGGWSGGDRPTRYKYKVMVETEMTFRAWWMLAEAPQPINFRTAYQAGDRPRARPPGTRGTMGRICSGAMPFLDVSGRARESQRSLSSSGPSRPSPCPVAGNGAQRYISHLASRVCRTQ